MTLDFEAIYACYRPKIRAYLTRLVEEQEAEDLAQEVFIKIERDLQKFRGEAQLSTWIYRIATNAALDRLRSSAFKQQDRELAASDSMEKMDTVESLWNGEQASEVDQHLIRREMNACIREYIDGLPEQYRTVIVLSEVEGFKNREIAEVLQISIDAVKIRLHRARRKLQATLQNRCNFYRDERGELACDRKKPT